MKELRFPTIGSQGQYKELRIELNSTIADKVMKIRNSYYVRTGHKPTQIALTPLEYLELSVYMHHGAGLPTSASSFTLAGIDVIAQTKEGVTLTDHNLIVSEACKESGLSTKNTTACNHQWKQYRGLVENYTYCELCDERK